MEQPAFLWGRLAVLFFSQANPSLAAFFLPIPLSQSLLPYLPQQPESVKYTAPSYHHTHYPPKPTGEGGCALNKAYRKEKVLREALDNFKVQLYRPSKLSGIVRGADMVNSLSKPALKIDEGVGVWYTDPAGFHPLN